MKNKLKKITRVIFLFATLLLVSCSEDLYEESPETKTNLKIDRVKFKDLQISSNNRLSKTINSLVEYKKTATTNKLVYDEIYDFYIDQENGVSVNLNGKESYTFPIFKSQSDGTVENIIFNENENGEFSIILADYSLTKYELDNLDHSLNEGDVRYYDMSKLGATELVCVDMITTIYGNCNHTHSNGYTCEPEIVTHTFCSWVTSDGAGGGGSPDGSGGSNTGGNGDTGGSTGGGSGGGVVTSPNSGLTTAQYQLLSQLNTTAGETFYTFDETVTANILNYIESISTNNQLINSIAYFLNNTNTLWLSNQSVQSQQGIFNYLIANGFSTQSRGFLNNAITYCNNNGNTPEILNEVNNILSLLTNGTINGQPVDFGDSTPITNMANYLNCFNTTQGATLTISADQPDSGDHDLYTTSGGVGHSFITIKQGNNVKSFGFYPQSSIQSIIPNNLTTDPNDFFSTPGEFHNNENTVFDVSLSVPISAAQLTNLINGTIAVANSSPVYNLSSLNCTDVAIMIFEANTNVNIPSCESPNILWDGQTPGTLGEVLRNLPTPTGGTKDINGGTSPQNNCN